MKQTVFLTVVLFAFLSCQSSLQRDLNLAESLLQDNPDSALSCLNAIQPNRITKTKEEARYALLVSAAKDKNHIDVSSDSLIKIAVDYYSQHGDTRHRMLANYYHGIVLKNGKQFSGAIVALEKAEKNALMINDSYQLGLIYRNMANVFSESNNPQEAIQHRKKAIASFEEAQAVLYQTYAELSLAIDYINNNDFENADSLLIAISDKTNSPSILSRCNTSKAVVLINNGGDMAEALRLYKSTPVKYLSFMDYGYYALATEAAGQKDSTDYWISKGYSLCKDWADSASLDYFRSRIALRRRQYEEAYHLVDKAAKSQDAITRTLLQQSVSGAQRDYYKAESIHQEELLKAARREKTLIGIISFLLVIISLLSLLAVSKKKERQLKELLTRLSLERKDIDLLCKNNAHLLGSLFSARITHLDKLSKAYFLAEDKQEKEAAFYQIKKSVASLRNNPELFQSLENDLNQYCGGIISKLRTQVPRIKGNNLRIIILFFAGFPYDVVQLIMGSVSIDSLKMTRSRFRKEIIAAKAPDEAVFLELLEMKKRPQDYTNES